MPNCNQVHSTDFNVLSVLHIAVELLAVRHIIVCGHSNCSALRSAEGPRSNGILDHWLSGIRNTIRRNRTELEGCASEHRRRQRMSELNVLQQLGTLSRTPTVLDAWSRGKWPSLHGWVYDVGNGHVERVVDAVDSVESATRLLPQG